MKKAKRSLSLILAATMALSACTVGFTAWAADATEIKKIEDDIIASSTISDELAGRFKALTADEKDQISAEAYVKIFNKMYTAQTGTTQEKEVASETLLGGHSTKGKLAKELAILSDGKTPVTIKDGISVGKDLVLGATSVSSYNFTKDYTSTDFADDSKQTVVTVPQQKLIAQHLFEVYNALSGDARALLISEAFTVGTGSYKVGEVTKYYYYNYMGTYQNTFFTTNRTLGVAAKLVDAEKATMTPVEKQAEIFKIVKIPSADPYNMQAGLDNAITIAAALDAFRATGNEKNFRKVVDPWLVASDVKGSIEFFGSKIIKDVVACEGKLQSVSSIKATIKKEIKLIEGKATAIEFGKYLEAIKLPEKGSAEFNVTVNEVKAEYKKLTTEAKNYVKNSLPETYALYNQILGLAVLIRGEGTHEVFTDSIKIDAEMSGYIGNAVYETLVPTVGNLLKTFLSPEALKGSFDMLFTNESVTAALKMIYPALYGALSGMDPVMGQPVPALFELTPAQLGFSIRRNYAEASAELLKYGKLSADGTKLEDPGTIEDWAKVLELDWGITDGDYEQFITALLTGMKGIFGGLGGGFVVSGIVKKVLVGKYSMTPDGSTMDETTFKPAAWDYLIIPLFEALGVEGKDMPTAKEYALSVKANGESLLGYLKPITDTLYYDLLPAVQKTPLDYIVSNLPNLVHHLQDGCIVNGLNRAIDSANVDVFGNVIDLKPMVMGLFADADGNLPAAITLEMVWGMVAPMLSDAGINVTLEDLLKIGKMGTAAVVDTTRAEVDSTVKVTADKESVMNYIINALASLIENAGIDLGVKGQFVKVQVPAYPHNGKMDKKAVNALISGLEETIGGFVNIEDAINGALATNEMAGTAIKGIYDMVANLLGTVNATTAALGMTIAPIAPSRVAEMLGDANEFKALAAELKDSDTWADVAFTIKNDDGEVLKQVDMGFKNGDLKGFVATIVASLRPLVDELQKVVLITNKTVDGETSYGLYETLIIPAFEALGIKPVATSATFTDNFNKLYAKDNNAGLDYILNTILKPVLTLLDRVKANPIATIMDVLPNIAYALKYSPATAFVGNILLGDKNLADVLGGLVEGLLPGLKLNAINLDAIISCGEIKEVDSMSALNKTYSTIVVDRADMFVTAFYYLFDTINTGDNLKLVKDLLANVEMEAGLKTVVDGLVNSLFDMTREEALCTLGATFADWTCPNAEDANGGNKGTNGKTPGTGDTAISAIAVVSVLFTAGAAIVLLRKKKTIAE